MNICCHNHVCLAFRVALCLNERDGTPLGTVCNRSNTSNDVCYNIIEKTSECSEGCCLLSISFYLFLSKSVADALVIYMLEVGSIAGWGCMFEAFIERCVVGGDLYNVTKLQQ